MYLWYTHLIYQKRSAHWNRYALWSFAPQVNNLAKLSLEKKPKWVLLGVPWIMPGIRRLFTLVAPLCTLVISSLAPPLVKSPRWTWLQSSASWSMPQHCRTGALSLPALAPRQRLPLRRHSLTRPLPPRTVCNAPSRRSLQFARDGPSPISSYIERVKNIPLCRTLPITSVSKTQVTEGKMGPYWVEMHFWSWMHMLLPPE
jgi:hypothetical protein